MKTTLAVMLCLVRLAAAQSLSSLQSDYLSQHCGLFFSWNMSTFQPNANAGAGGWATPNQNINTFAPTVSASTLQSNMNAWMTTAVAAGCKYVELTTKHVDGFSLWPTSFAVSGFSPYSVAGTTWYASNSNPDLILMFANLARANGLKVAFYFAAWDRTLEARDTNCVAGAGSQSAQCFADYLVMFQQEITELLSNYGTITALFIDTPEYPYIAIPSSTLHNFPKTIQPACLVILNNHAHTTTNTDIVEYEIPFGDVISTTNVPSEGIDTIKSGDTYWFFNSGNPGGYTVAQMQPQAALASNVSFWNKLHDGNYLIDLTPDTAGAIPAAEIIVSALMFESLSQTFSGLTFGGNLIQ